MQLFNVPPQVYLQSSTLTARPIVRAFNSPNIETASGFTYARKMFAAMIKGILSAPRHMDKNQVEFMTKSIASYVDDLIYFASLSPEIIGISGGISMENGRMLATAVLNKIAAQSLAGAAFADPVRSPLGWHTTLLTASSWANAVSGLKSIITSEGQISIPHLVTADAVKCNYYPMELNNLLMKIQAEYDQKSLGAEYGLISPNPAKFASFKQNSVYGEIQFVIPELVGTIPASGLAPHMFRREEGNVMLGFGNQPIQVPSQVMICSSYTVRCAIKSALEMAIVLGMVRKEVVKSENGGPNSTVYQVLRNSLFGQLVELTRMTKHNFNQAGNKDFEFYKKERPQFLDQTGMCYWRSYDHAKSAGDLMHFGSASLIVEIETRLRISDGAVRKPRGEAKDKKTKMPNMGYFMRNPREFYEFMSLFTSGTPAKEAFELTPHHRDFEARVSLILGQAGGIELLKIYYTAMYNACQANWMVYVIHHICESVNIPAVSKAKITKTLRH